MCRIQYPAASGTSTVGRAGIPRCSPHSGSFGEDQSWGSAPSSSGARAGGGAKAQTKATAMRGVGKERRGWGFPGPRGVGHLSSWALTVAQALA